MKMKLLAMFLSLVICISLVPPTTASAQDTITLKLNGAVLTTDVAPVIESGRTLVPARTIVEALRYSVLWDEAAQRVDILYPTDVVAITMYIGDYNMTVRGTTNVTLDAPPRIIDGRTLIPVRALAEALGFTVSWDANSRTVSIETD